MTPQAIRDRAQALVQEPHLWMEKTVWQQGPYGMEGTVEGWVQVPLDPAQPMIRDGFIKIFKPWVGKPVDLHVTVLRTSTP